MSIPNISTQLSMAQSFEALAQAIFTTPALCEQVAHHWERISHDEVMRAQSDIARKFGLCIYCVREFALYDDGTHRDMGEVVQCSARGKRE